MWIEQLAELEIAYPTYTAVIGLAARHIVRELGVMPLEAQWRTLASRISPSGKEAIRRNAFRNDLKTLAG